MSGAEASTHGPVMADPDCQITAIECYAGWDITSWCRWSVTTTDAPEDDPTLRVVVSARNESHVRTVTVAQVRSLARNLTTLADHMDAIDSARPKTAEDVRA